MKHKAVAHGVEDYPTLLREIRKRPQMFHGGEERSALLLRTFLGGIQYSEYFHSISKYEIMSGFSWESFEPWVMKRYNPKRLSLDSLSLANYLASNESEGFDLWFSWYDKFNEQNLT